MTRSERTQPNVDTNTFETLKERLKVPLCVDVTPLSWPHETQIIRDMQRARPFSAALRQATHLPEDGTAASTQTYSACNFVAKLQKTLDGVHQNTFKCGRWWVSRKTSSCPLATGISPVETVNARIDLRAARAIRSQTNQQDGEARMRAIPIKSTRNVAKTSSVSKKKKTATADSRPHNLSGWPWVIHSVPRHGVFSFHLGCPSPVLFFTPIYMVTSYNFSCISINSSSLTVCNKAWHSTTQSSASSTAASIFSWCFRRI